MKLLHFTQRTLSPKADDLIQFDIDSIRQVAGAKGGTSPDVWLADPDLYEKNGRVLRDSSTPRLLAYSPHTKTLYATDGCNSCTHVLPGDLSSLSEVALREIASKNNIRIELLEKLAAETR
jgi:hypothetical protein